ncbi:MAG: hypothetical protein NVS9B4_15570 [Candidatus Acidiferrum sp.]
MSVSPTPTTVAVTQTKQFSAAVTGTANTSVTWSVNGGAANGTISASGLYTAPTSVPNPATITVTATSQANTSVFGTATATIAGPPSGVTVQVVPNRVTLPNFGTQQFSAVVSGSTNQAVSWQVNGATGGTMQFGFISGSGFYVAPSGAPTKSDGAGGSTADGATITVTAVPQADTTTSSSAAITIAPGNALLQSGPIKLGTSGGNARDSVTISSSSGTRTICCGGTLGSLVKRGGVQYILSNNHILAKSDSGKVGDNISQPSIIDTSCDPSQTNTVATLSQFFSLVSSPTPNIDAAIAQVLAGKVDPGGNILYLGATATNGVPDPGAPNSGPLVGPAVGMTVAKSGRSTGLTCAAIGAINTNTTVQYTGNCDGTGAKFSVQYANQVDIFGGGFSAGGDSGSLIVTQSTADPIALLFAGSDSDTVGNPVSDVLNFFKSGTDAVTFVGGGPHAVIGCALPNAPQSASASAQSAILLQSAREASAETLEKAASARDIYRQQLLAHPAMQAVGVGASYDNPEESAVVLFVTRGQPHSNLPAQVAGVRTRIVEGDLFRRRGALNAEESAEMEQTVAPPQAVYAISEAEVARAKAVHIVHVADVMKWPGVQGVGIGSSVDSPGEAALMIFIIRGVPHDPIPAVIDGLRTRVRESSRFVAGSTSHDARFCALPVQRAKVALAKSAAKNEKP